MTVKIYKVVNEINNKLYIGQTTKPIEERLRQHLSKARQQCNNNHFHNAIVKYGEDKFSIYLVEDNVPIEEAIEKESFYIKKYDSVNSGYNMKYTTEDPRYKTIVTISKEDLEDLYITQGLSTLKIAKMFGVVNTTVGNRLKFFDIPTRNCGEGNRLYNLIQKEELERLLLVENKTAKEVATLYNVPKYIITNLQKKYLIFRYRVVKI